MLVKLWLYFILFAAVLVALLWLMQIVFLQSFYEAMKVRGIEQAADEIVAAYGSDAFEDTMTRAAYVNSILICVTDREGNLLYAADEHDAAGKPHGQAGPRIGMEKYLRSLPKDFGNFLERLEGSENDRISYTLMQKNARGRMRICGAKLPDAVLFISSPFESINATTQILREQLVYVTFVALLLSFVIAYFIARKFSRPIAAITAQAKEMATGSFPASFDKGFCAELDELAGALDHASAELSKVEGLRRELLANISHDLRTPLTMIKAYTEMIRDISGGDKSKRERHLAIIAAETDRLTELVSDILAFSSFQSGSVALSIESIDVSATVKKVLSRFEPVFALEGYRFVATIEPDQVARADGKTIEQVLYNLIGNAMNYAGDDKEIVVKVLNRGGWVRVEVADHGEGIAPDEVALIWDRYYKSKDHRRGKLGTGLGLSIVKSILDLHSAPFGVESELGAGSTFWFELQK